MCITQIFIYEHQGSNYNVFDLNFIILCLSVFFIAGAGNIINDYFDVKADKINKVDKLIIGKYISRRTAIVSNWLFNLSGFLFASYLSYIHSNWLIVIIAFIFINFLWFYSSVYKRKFLTGNILVALMISSVPLYVLLYNFPFEKFKNIIFTYRSLQESIIFEAVFIISLIAFTINLSREFVKDIADIQGDMKLFAKTIPISLGIRKTKIIIGATTLLLLILMSFYIYKINLYHSLTLNQNDLNNYPQIIIFNALTSSSGLICIISLILTISTDKRKRYIIASNLLKLAMLFGMISMLYINK